MCAPFIFPRALQCLYFLLANEIFMAAKRSNIFEHSHRNKKQGERGDGDKFLLCALYGCLVFKTFYM